MSKDKPLLFTCESLTDDIHRSVTAIAQGQVRKGQSPNITITLGQDLFDLYCSGIPENERDETMLMGFELIVDKEKPRVFEVKANDN